MLLDGSDTDADALRVRIAARSGPILQALRPMPDYDLSEAGAVRLTIYGSVVDPAYSRLLIQKTDLPLVDVLALDQMLETLQKFDPRAAQIVELRYFGGYAETEIAEMLGISDRTLRRDWRKARAFLLAEMQA